MNKAPNKDLLKTQDRKQFNIVHNIIYKYLAIRTQ